ncbi:MAG: endo alpha-1,4 polygalactosaminidase [Chloroflexi bacterium]|nr:endo alpha-1,4 polygalactosaminidase [Chloroflexota bacterium]
MTNASARLARRYLGPIILSVVATALAACSSSDSAGGVAIEPLATLPPPPAEGASLEPAETLEAQPTPAATVGVDLVDTPSSALDEVRDAETLAPSSTLEAEPSPAATSGIEPASTASPGPVETRPTEAPAIPTTPAAASPTPSQTPPPMGDATVKTSDGPDDIGLTNTSSWVYWISDVDLDAIAAVAPSIAVIDYAADGSEDTVFIDSDIARLRAGMTSPARVIAYMSIGEAEDYRYYWEQEWEPGSPQWITSTNPDWEGNFKVEYWNSEWQGTIFGNPRSYLDQIIAAGFDGVYLDIIDAYEFYEDRGVDDARERMIEFVSDLATYARGQSPGFLIVPQNAPELGANPAYLGVVDGIGMESVYFGYDETGVANDPSTTAELESQLKRFTDAGKFVLSVDYVDTPSGVASAYQRARLQGFLPTVTDVDLDGLPIPEPQR